LASYYSLSRVGTKSSWNFIPILSTSELELKKAPWSGQSFHSPKNIAYEPKPYTEGLEREYIQTLYQLMASLPKERRRHSNQQRRFSFFLSRESVGEEEDGKGRTIAVIG
jgi:hypothetical protein